jgi:ATP-dependent RNA helicase RhlE
LHGGVGYGAQLDGLENNPDIVMATPGRLLDHMSRGTLKLDQIKYLVLDEVDRMLDMGFLPDVKKIIDQCPKERQTLFFSATMPPQIETLASWVLTDPLDIEIGERRSPAETVTHAFYPVAMDQRDDLVFALVDKTHFESLMIFTRTKKEADALHAKLRDVSDARVAVLHSDIKQSDRTKALNGFRSGEFDVIIATDLAARGLDVTRVTHVINYRVPENAEDYVHRIGRTGRAYQEGDAFTLLSADELDYAKAVEHFIGQKIDRKKLEGFDYIYTALLDEDAQKPLKKRRAPKRRKR